MPSTPFSFDNARGETLVGVLETGEAAPATWAVFAHCFSCGMNSLAAVRLSRALAEEGVGVLRFDFAGLGDSEGEFARGLSADAADLRAATAAMQAAGQPVRLFIGHSFGGAACLAAAPLLPEIAGVATIGAPFAAEHILRHLPAELRATDGAGEALEAEIAGRAFRVSPRFANDLAEQDQAARIASLDRPLLVLHSPQDDVVGIENAALIYQAARHPKSFVCLDGADHLLTGADDAAYAARIIAAWFSRYCA
jgi:putative redox protein